MTKFEASTKENKIIFMSNICMIVSEYADDKNIRLSHLADEFYETALADEFYETANRFDEIELPDDHHIKVYETDDEDIFIAKIITAVAAYAYANDTDFTFLITGIWYALTRAQMEDLFND